MTTDWQVAATALAAQLADFDFCGVPADFDRIGIACSGGADSLCALLLTWAVFPRERKKMRVLHFNHESRGAASDGDEAFVRQVAATLELEFVAGTLSDYCGNERASEEIYRRARLKFLAENVRDGERCVFIQGHQADDVVETMIMRLARGSGAGGLCAPRPFSKMTAEGKTFFLQRPLLRLPKSKITAALRDCGIAWREDASNREDDFFRNRVRHHVVPALKSAMPENFDLYTCFLRSRETLQSEAEALEAAGFEKAVPVAKKIFEAFWRKFEPVTFDAAAGFCGNGIRVEPVRLDENLRERIFAGAERPAEYISVPENARLTLRHWLPGDRMRTLGSKGSKTIGDLFTDRKIPRERRIFAPVLVCGNDIFWCAGLPPAQKAGLDATTRFCLKVTICEKIA